MTSALIVHSAAGGVGILAGAIAVSVRKGGRLHRSFGTAFFVSMLIGSALAAYVALTLPPSHGVSTPPKASVSVALLTVYLVATGWATVRRGEGRAGAFEAGACLAGVAIAAVLLTFGVQAASGPAAGSAPMRYFVFAAFAAFSTALDLKVVLRGGVSGPARLARHLWRMCLALFFAASFFFLGQQRVLPTLLRGSPLLVLLAIAPLGVMAFWLVRVRLARSSVAAVRPLVAATSPPG